MDKDTNDIQNKHYFLNYHMFASLCSQLRNDFSFVYDLVQEGLALFVVDQHGVLMKNSK